MKISYNWLGSYVNHGWSAEKVADALTMAGLEVESVERAGARLDGIVVGEVLETRKHPDADRLTLCDVRLGESDPVQIVCGAPNVAPGQKVAVATVGTTLLMPSRKQPGELEPVTIQPTKIRGESSEGMICAEDELGLSNDHSGILVLDADAEVGQPLAGYFSARGMEAGDAVIDVSITPNRPDATSHIGIARDVAALSNQLLGLPDVEVPEPGGKVARDVSVRIEAPEQCPRYVAMVVRGVRVGPSPEWLRRRLETIGLRPRNNVVDVTNFVMHECGQPLHAFDLTRLAGQRIEVRLAANGERFTTLDSRERELPEGALLICDAEKAVAVAGVMGGENSEVTDETTDVLIESAYFEPSSIRRTARALGLQTDSSYRFERGVDPCNQVWAAARAAHLIGKLAGGTLVPGCVDANAIRFQPTEVRVRPSRVNRLLGVDIPPDEIERMLEAIGFAVRVEDPLDRLAELALEGRGIDLPADETTFCCRVPSFRPDIEREVDVIEEIARLWGFDRIPESTRMNLPAKPWSEPTAATLRTRATHLLAGLGFREIYSNSMLRAETAERFNADTEAGDAGPIVETLNPISLEMAALRPSLLPGIIQAIVFNQNHGQELLRFFEFGHVFHRSAREGTIIPGFAERESLILAACGPAASRGWDSGERETDFFDIKGVVEALLQTFRVPKISFSARGEGDDLTAYRIEVRAHGSVVGLIARAADGLQEEYGLRRPLFFAELNWQAITTLVDAQGRQAFHPVSRFPVVERDLAVVVHEDVPVGSMLETIRSAAPDILRGADVFDIYQGEHIGEGVKSVAFSLRFGASRTLLDEEADAAIKDVLEVLSREHDARIR
jgi:phenylalanyl-tRNA synthetase beta chain